MRVDTAEEVNVGALAGTFWLWELGLVTTDRWRTGVALVFALGVHVGVARVVRPRGHAPQSHLEVPSEDVIVVVSEAEPAAAPPVPSSASPDNEPARTGLAAAERARRPAFEGAPTAVDAVGSTPPREAPAAGSAWTFQPTAPSIHPRGTDFVAWNGVRANAEPPAPISSTGGLIEALDLADVERGLGRGGPVRTAVEVAARGDGPVRGSATFSVTVFSDGRVDVQVASAQTDWARLIPAIRDAVRESKVRVPPRSRGLTVIVAVDASVRYPNGYAPPDATEVQASATMGGAAPSDPVSAGAPTVTVQAHGRRCSANVTVTMGGLGAGADCAAGVAARRVAARIVAEQRL